MINILSDERIDDLQCKGYKIIQKPQGFCFGMDAVLLSDFANVKKGQKVLDLCTGTGVIPILLAGKTKGEHFTGLEIQKDYVDMAKRSVVLNELEDKVDMIMGDVKKVKNLFSQDSFDIVTVNPPYMTKNQGLNNPHESKNIARHEILCELEDIISASTGVLKHGGRFFMVHKPFRLAEIIDLMIRYKLEPKRIRLVQPYVDKEANMVLIEGIKGAKSHVNIEPTLIVYEKNGDYTNEIKEIYNIK